MELFKKFVKRIDDDFGYDNEKLARDLQKIAEEHQALQLQQTGVSGSIKKNSNKLQDGYYFVCFKGQRTVAMCVNCRFYLCGNVNSYEFSDFEYIEDLV